MFRDQVARTTFCDRSCKSHTLVGLSFCAQFNFNFSAHFNFCAHLNFCAQFNFCVWRSTDNRMTALLSRQTTRVFYGDLENTHVCIHDNTTTGLQYLR